MNFRKILIRIILILLIVVTTILVVRAVFNYMEGRRLARTLADLKEQGIPLTMGDLASPCPDENNAARLWKAAQELLVIEGEDVKLINEAWQNFVRGNPFKAGDIESLSRLIEKNREALDLVLQAAGKPCFRFGDLDVKAFERKIPDAIKMLRAIRLLGFGAVFSAERGDVRGAIEELRNGLRFAPKIAEENSLITFLVAVAEMKQVLFCLNKTVSGRDCDAELLFPVISDLDDLSLGSWKELFVNSVRGEKILFLDVGLTFMTEKIHWALSEPDLPQEALYWLIRPLMKRDIVRCLPKYLELEEIVRQPYHQTREFWKSYKDEIDHLPWHSVISKMVLPDLEASRMKLATLEALVLTTRTGLACRVFKARNGRYPNSLDELVPGLIPAVPADPFTGDPLVFKRKGEGFILYSLGSNQKDDGGRSTWEITQLVMEKDDDWTWKEVR